MQVHTNTIESFWSGLKRGIMATYHSISAQHTESYAQEFAARYASRGLSVVEQVMGAVT